MAYYDAAALADDQDFMRRCGMCAETEGIPDGWEWGIANRYSLAAAPGFGDAYASALAAGVPNPGRDQSVVSDAQILSAVQTLAASP
jgi:hypothetical protein